MIMPDGYSVDLDQFHGLDQIGEEGLKDKVNNHYLRDLRDFDCPGRHRRVPARSRKAVERITTRVRRHSRPEPLERFAVGNHGPRPVHSDSADYHHPGGSSRQGLFHPGHASCQHTRTTRFRRRSEEMIHAQDCTVTSHRNSHIAVLAGCQSHQAKVDALQKEYDQLQPAISSKDCSAEYLKVAPDLSPKCTDESKKMATPGNSFKQERAKQVSHKENTMKRNIIVCCSDHCGAASR